MGIWVYIHVCWSLVLVVLRGPFLYLIETPVAGLIKGLKRNRGLKNGCNRHGYACVLFTGCIMYILVVYILKRLIETAVDS